MRMINKKLYISFAILLAASCFVNAEGSGVSTTSTLLQSVSSRISAMSEACSGLEGSVEVLDCNPAGIHSIQKVGVSLMYKRGLVEDNFASIQLGRAFRFGSIGMSLRYYNTGKVELYDSIGNRVSKIGKRDAVASLGYAKLVSGFPLGINLKAVSSEIFGEKTTAVAVDLSAQRKLRENINTGIFARNIGSKFKYIEKKESLPVIVGGGFTYKQPLGAFSSLISLDLHQYMHEKDSLLKIGGEIGRIELGFIRAGYSANLSDSTDNAISLGFGLTFSDYQIDYSIGLLDDIDSSHNISLSAKF